MIYLLNTPILTDYGLYKFSGPLTIEQIKAKLKQGYDSAIGHQATSDVMSLLLKQEIKANRQAIKMQKGDQAIVFRLLQRVPEGTILSKEELLKLPFEFSFLERVE